MNNSSLEHNEGAYPICGVESQGTSGIPSQPNGNCSRVRRKCANVSADRGRCAEGVQRVRGESGMLQVG